jgi:hypothetical protein
MLKKGIDWLLGKAGEGVKLLFSTTADGIGYTALELEPIFIIIAMVGIFLILFGEKRWGTRLTSLSIITYTIARIML